MTLAAWIHRAVETVPDKDAVVSSDGRRLTYREFGQRVNRAVNGYHACGLTRGDRIAVMLNNTSEAVESVAAAAVGGFVHVPISPRLSGAEMVHILAHSGAAALVIDQEYADLVKVVPDADLPGLILIADLGRDDSAYETWLAEHSSDAPEIEITPEDDFLLIYTSGTTGQPKGVHHKQRQSLDHAIIPVRYYDMDRDSNLLMVYPHNSIASINMFYVPAWKLGATVTMFDPRRFDGDRWLEVVERERITHCHLVPTMLYRVMDCAKISSHDISTLRTIGYGSASMSPDRVRHAFDLFGEILVQGYGLTEYSSIAAVLGKSDHRAALDDNAERLASFGRPTAGTELRLVDDDGNDVPHGEAGEIAVRGTQAMCGYWKDPETTRAAIPDGWLRTGDMARCDDEGFLYMVDRKKDLIVSGGYNIGSKEVEEVLLLHPAVAEIAVVGRPDGHWGERVHAFVVSTSGATVDEAALIEFCRKRLAGYKCPDRIEAIDELPRNPLGKVIKRALKTQFKTKEREAI